MATPPSKFHCPRLHLQTAALISALVAVGLSGCATTIRAGKVPVAFQAPKRTNVQETGLKNLVIPPANSQMVDRGDVLEVTIVTDFGDMRSMTTPVRVGRDGTANIPLIGRVALAGFELDEAAPIIAAEAVARGVFRKPHITVTMKRKRTNQVTVLGAVKEPGVYELPCSACSLLAALVTAGDLTEEAGDEVVIRRPPGAMIPRQLQPPRQHVAGAHPTELAAYHPAQPAVARRASITRISLAAASPDDQGAYRLNDGDVVIVAKRVPKPIYVMGLVNNPGEYELPANQDVYMLDAIAKAGERTIQVADRVHIIRRVPGQEEPIVIVASIKEAKQSGAANERLAPGDIVSVEETPTTVVLDAVKSFIRFGISSSIPLF